MFSFSDVLNNSVFPVLFSSCVHRLRNYLFLEVVYMNWFILDTAHLLTVHVQMLYTVEKVCTVGVADLSVDISASHDTVLCKMQEHFESFL